MIFDYRAPATLFMAKRKGRARQPIGYRRFSTAVEAICFVVEKFPAMRTLGAINASTAMKSIVCTRATTIHCRAEHQTKVSQSLTLDLCSHI